MPDMDWKYYSNRSMHYAEQAYIAKKESRHIEARGLYRLAAELEQISLNMLDIRKTKTYCIVAVNAVTLWAKAGEIQKAIIAANDCILLASTSAIRLPDWAMWQLSEKRLLNFMDPFCA